MGTVRTTTPTPAINLALARRLVDAQFPRYTGLALAPFDPAGSDHALYRLGEDLSVRLPLRSGPAGEAAKEARWLPRLAPGLPLPIPVPVAVGEPGEGYPWPWAITRWLDGRVATVEALGESREAAVALAGFLTALQGCVPEGMPVGDPPADLAGRPLADRDQATRAAIAQVSGTFDTAALTALWDAALAAPGWDRAPVWFHGDFHTGNLLTDDDGRLSAVIDFGGLGIGDPACDLMVAYTLLAPETRAVFRDALGVDEATWLRGRGWALATGLNAYTAYAADVPRVAAQTTRQINQSLIG